jgi:cell division protein FtsW (lipid II flippase)
MGGLLRGGRGGARRRRRKRTARSASEPADLRSIVGRRDGAHDRAGEPSAYERRGADGLLIPRTLDEAARAEKPAALQWFNPGWLVVLASLALAGIGLAGISASGGLDGMSGRLSTEGLVLKQSLFVVVGLVACAVAAAPHFRVYMRLTPLVAGVALALLVFVLIPFVPEAIVTPRNGARRWISLGFTDVQPSELAKIAFVLATALYLRHRTNHRTLVGLTAPASIAVVPMGLILVEPDLGTSLLFFPALFAMLLAAGAKLLHLFSTAAVGSVFAGLIVAVSLFMAGDGRYPLLRPHQVERIQAVMDQFTGEAELHIQERGFQGYKARTLIGAGGVRGHEPTRSRAFIEYSRLPEGHNDMIFAVIANRFGLVGCAIVIGLYLVWFVAALAVAGLCKDPFGRLITVGFAGLILTQAGINIGMTIGILPITGMTLPFVSYGGSSLVTVFAMAGIVLNVGLRRPERLYRPSFEFAGDG